MLPVNIKSIQDVLRTSVFLRTSPDFHLQVTERLYQTLSGVEGY